MACAAQKCTEPRAGKAQPVTALKTSCFPLPPPPGLDSSHPSGRSQRGPTHLLSSYVPPYDLGFCFQGSKWSVKVEVVLISFYLVHSAPSHKAGAS